MQFQIALQIEKLSYKVGYRIDDIRGLFSDMPGEHLSNLGQRRSETTSMLGSDMLGREDEKRDIISLVWIE